MPQPTLTTPRLNLTPLNDTHLPLEIALDTDPLVTRYLFARPRSPAFIRRNNDNRMRLAASHPGLGYWVAHLRTTSEPIGWFLLDTIERVDQGSAEGQAELGYRLLPPFWRQGFATEGARAVVGYAFRHEGLTLERVFAETMVVNAGSRATMVKLGMKYVRTFHLDWDSKDVVEGYEEGEVEYAVTREEWARLRGNADRI